MFGFFMVALLPSFAICSQIMLIFIGMDMKIAAGAMLLILFVHPNQRLSLPPLSLFTVALTITNGMRARRCPRKNNISLNNRLFNVSGAGHFGHLPAPTVSLTCLTPRAQVRGSRSARRSVSSASACCCSSGLHLSEPFMCSSQHSPPREKSGYDRFPSFTRRSRTARLCKK